MITPTSWLMRCPTYKDMMAQLKDRDIATYGFLGYPCLMASDILLYNADFVPVGEDQAPHLEMTREIARRFNFLYGPVFQEPQPLFTKARVLLGTDGRKMSKSYGNTIMLSDSPDDVRKKVMSMVTDPARIRKDDPGHPDICSVFLFHKLLSAEVLAEIESDCRQGKIGCVQCNRNLSERLCEYMSPIYNRRRALIQKPGLAAEILREGGKKALPKARATMRKVREAVKLVDIAVTDGGGA
jgi:tryptophanyl-tRNA synthetase